VHVKGGRNVSGDLEKVSGAAQKFPNVAFFRHGYLPPETARAGIENHRQGKKRAEKAGPS